AEDGIRYWSVIGVQTCALPISCRSPAFHAAIKASMIPSDFRVLGEAEGIIDAFIAAWNAGDRHGTFEAEKFKADVTKTPIPRYEVGRASCRETADDAGDRAWVW